MMDLVRLAIDGSFHLYLISGCSEKKEGSSCYLTDVELNNSFPNLTDFAP